MKCSSARRMALLLFFILILPVPEVCAQSGGFSGAFTRMGFGPRGMAMGNALTTVSREGIYAHYNPALSSYIEEMQFDLSSALMSFDRNLHAINTTFFLPPSAGLNIGLLNAHVKNIDGRTSSGYHTENLSTNEFQLFAAFGIGLSPRVKLGASVKLHLSSLHKEIDHATGAGFDLGLIIQPISSWRIGIIAQDLISDYSWNTTSIYGTQDGRTRRDPFPVRFRIGTSQYFASWNLLLSSEFEIQRQRSEYQHTQIIAGSTPPQSVQRTENITTSSQLFRIGVSWAAHERLTIRGGWEILDLEFVNETYKLSTGFSVHLPYDAYSPSIDYAFVREPLGISSMHVLALRIVL